MSRLTWQNVAAPDFSAAARTQAYAAEAFDKAMGRVSGSITAFDNNRKDTADAAVMRNMMQYQNADELQAAIASGALMQGVNPDHVRADALLKAQSQAGNLLKLDQQRQQLSADKQSFDFNAQNDPIKLQQAQHNLNKGEYTFGRTQESDARSDEERLANEGAQREFAALQQGGKFQTVADIATWGRGQDLNTPQGRAAYKMAQSQAPDAFKLMDPVTPLPGAAGAAAGALNSIGGPSTSDYMGANGKPLSGTAATFARALHGQESSFGAADTSKINEHGVTGPMQVQDKTFEGMKTMGLIPKEWSHTNPKHNMDAGTIWSEHLLNKHGGDIARAAAEYYSGPKAVNADGSINRDRRDLKNPKSPTVGEYVDQVLKRAQQGASRYEVTARADQAGVAVLDKANQQGIPQNRRIVQALQAGLDGKTDTSLRGTIGRHTTQGGMFAGVDSDQVEKLLQEIDQKIGGGGNFEVAAAILADQSTETLGKWRDWVPGIRGSGKHFDADTVKKAVDQFKANGGMQLYTRQAADSAVRAAMDSQQQNTAAVETLTKQVQDAQRLAASGNPTAVQQLPLLEQQLQAARQTAVKGSGEAFTQYGPTPNPRRATVGNTADAGVSTQATPAGTAPAGHDEFMRNFGKPKARPEVVPAQEAAAPAAPPRRVVSWPAPMTPARISTMTAAEAAAVLRDPQKVRQLPPNVKLMLEARAGA